MSKKTFPTASTLTRAVFVTTFGTATGCAPSFGVLAASTYGYDWPPSTDSEILTFAVPTGATFVSATSHVTVRVAPAVQAEGAFGTVTRNGPAFGASVRVVSGAAFVPPLPSRAVKR